METSSLLDYYAAQGPLTDPQDLAPLFDPLPADVAALCAVVQSLVIHVEWAAQYGLAA